jgi:hypothetical protein
MEKERMESEGVNTKKSVDDRVFLITSWSENHVFFKVSIIILEFSVQKKTQFC